MGELKRYNLESLYEKFKRLEITLDNIWTLDDDMLHLIGLTKIEQLKYKQALQKFKRTSWLMDELKKYNLESLYDKFHKAAGITIDNIWTLNDAVQHFIGLTKMEQFEYEKAAEKFKQHGLNNNMPRQNGLTLNELMKLLNSTTKVSQRILI